MDYDVALFQSIHYLSNIFPRNVMIFVTVHLPLFLCFIVVYYHCLDCFAFARNDVVFTLSHCERVEFLNDEQSKFRNSGEGFRLTFAPSP